MLYMYMYVVYFAMYDSVLIILLSYGHLTMIALIKYSYFYSYSLRIIHNNAVLMTYMKLILRIYVHSFKKFIYLIFDE